MPVKLHIGCGERYIPGFTHVDVRKFEHVDVVAPAWQLDVFEDDSVDLIYCCHTLEHLKKTQVGLTLAEWHRVLRPGGVLRLAVPDFAKICQMYTRTGDLSQLLGLLMGGQDYPENTHYTVYDYAYLAGLLQDAGFTSVRCYDWRETEHWDHDDFSQAYLPHMDKEHGTLMSLNVEAEKRAAGR
ncbi:methyltransferase domain-containing protein [Chloroflexota bacterium]